MDEGTECGRTVSVFLEVNSSILPSIYIYISHYIPIVDFIVTQKMISTRLEACRVLSFTMRAPESTAYLAYLEFLQIDY